MTDPIRDAAIEAAAKVLYLSNYPDDGRNRLGRRGHVLAACWEEAVPLVDAVLGVVEPALRAEALRDAADAHLPPINCELLPDGREDPETAAYVEFCRDLDQWLRDRADDEEGA